LPVAVSSRDKEPPETANRSPLGETAITPMPPEARSRCNSFAEEFGEALPQLADAQSLHGGDLVDDVELHRFLLCRDEETVNRCGQ
jgi:hypothetical protein